VYNVKEAGEKIVVEPTGDPWAIAAGDLWLNREQARELGRRLTEFTSWRAEEILDEDA